jgi:YDG domain/MBG domain (YGX type)
LTVMAKGVNKLYDGSTTATVTLSDSRISGDYVADSYLSASFADKNVGMGKPVTVNGITISGADATNYQLASATAATTADITARPLAITATGINKVYDGNSTATAILSDDRVSGDVFTESYSVANFLDKTAGAAKTINVTGISISGTDAGNYTFNTTATATADIAARPLTVTATGLNKVYDGTSTATVTLSDNRVPNDVFTDSYTTATFSDKTMGVGKTVSVTGISISGTDAANYAFNTSTSTNASITVRPLTISATGVNKVYDGSAAATVTLSDNRVAGDAFTDSDSSATFWDQNVGTGKTVTVTGIFISGADAGNYTFNSTAMTTACITPASLTITANNENKTYGATLTFTGTEFTTQGLINGDAVSSITLTSAGAAATATVAGSPYAIFPSAAVGTGLGNYNLYYKNGTLTLNPASLTITAKDASKTYGQSLGFAGKEFTLSGMLYNGDTVASVRLTSGGAATTATVTSPGPMYPITPSAAVGSGLGNYTIAYTNGTLTIYPAPLSITANNQSKTYGQTFTFMGTEFVASGLVNSDKVTSVSLASAGAPATATVTSPGPAYSIVPSGAIGSGLGNYTIAYANGSLTVTAASLTITAKDESKTYGATFVFAGTEFTTAGLVNSDSVSSVTLTSAGTAASGIPPSYPIVPSAAMGSGLRNYVITYINGTLDVHFATGGMCNNGVASHIILQPINADGSSVFKMGSTVPTKFVVCDANGNSVGPNTGFPNSSVVAKYYISNIMNGAGTLDETVYSTTPDASFRWDPTAQQWIFNTATGSGTTLNVKGDTYQLTIALIDGTTIVLQYGLK